MTRRLIHALARLGAAFAVIAIAVVPIVTVLRIAGNPFDPAALERPRAALARRARRNHEP